MSRNKEIRCLFYKLIIFKTESCHGKILNILLEPALYYIPKDDLNNIQWNFVFYFNFLTPSTKITATKDNTNILQHVLHLFSRIS